MSFDFGEFPARRFGLFPTSRRSQIGFSPLHHLLPSKIGEKLFGHLALLARGAGRRRELFCENRGSLALARPFSVGGAVEEKKIVIARAFELLETHYLGVCEAPLLR